MMILNNYDNNSNNYCNGEVEYISVNITFYLYMLTITTSFTVICIVLAVNRIISHFCTYCKITYGKLT